MLDDRRPRPEVPDLPARLDATVGARAAELRRRCAPELTPGELHALAGRIDAERERLTHVSGSAPSVAELARAAGCDVDVLVLVISGPHGVEDRRLNPLAVLLAFARGRDVPEIAHMFGATTGGTARVLRLALQRARSTADTGGGFSVSCRNSTKWV
ncbi:MAG: hypothetical protein ACSLFR_14435 [Solirubrobacteraceae bacterium]